MSALLNGVQIPKRAMKRSSISHLWHGLGTDERSGLNALETGVRQCANDVSLTLDLDQSLTAWKPSRGATSTIWISEFIDYVRCWLSSIGPTRRNWLQNLVSDACDDRTVLLRLARAAPLGIGGTQPTFHALSGDSHASM